VVRLGRRRMLANETETETESWLVTRHSPSSTDAPRWRIVPTAGRSVPRIGAARQQLDMIP
jgi:hypothetical protein